jgi:hypothetical protein
MFASVQLKHIKEEAPAATIAAVQDFLAAH